MQQEHHAETVNEFVPIGKHVDDSSDLKCTEWSQLLSFAFKRLTCSIYRD